MTDPRTLAATVVNQIYALHNVPMGGPMYKDFIKAFAHSLDYHAQECCLQRQMDRVLVDDGEYLTLPSTGNDTVQ